MKEIYILILILIITADTVGCNRYSLNNRAISNAEENLPMDTKNPNEQTKRINLQTISFSIPEGFENASSSSGFIKPKYSDAPRKRLIGSEIEKVFATRLNRGMKVSGSKDALEIKDIESARKSFHRETKGLKEASKELYGVKSAAVKITSFLDEQSLTKENFPTLKTGRAIAEIGGKTEYQREAFIFDTQSTFIYLKYVTEENHAEIKKRFERMIGCLEANTPQFTGEAQLTAEGYIRRYSGNVTLEVPADLIPSREFKYERYGVPDATTREASKIVRLTLLDPDDQEKTKELFEKEKKEIDPKYFDGEIEKSEQVTVEMKYYTGRTEKYFTVVNKSYEELNPQLVWRTVTLLGRFRDKSGNAIILMGKAPLEKEQELDGEFERWLQTFTPAEARGDNKQ